MTTPQPLTPSSSTESTEFTAPTGSTSIISPIEPVTQKKSPLVAILLTLLILATGTAAYFYSRLPKADPPWVDTTQSQPTASTKTSEDSTISPDLTANWETYVLDNYEMSFMHPSNWKLTESLIPDTDEWTGRNVFQIISSGASISHGVVSHGSYLTLSVVKPDINYSNFAEYLTYSTAQYSSSYTPKTINNILGQSFSTTNANNQGEGGFVFEKNSLIFVVNWIYSDNFNDITQILNSFQFTDQATATEKQVGYIKSITNNSVEIDQIEIVDDNSHPSGFRISNSSPTTQPYILSPSIKVFIVPELHNLSNNTLTLNEFITNFKQQQDLRDVPYDYEYSNNTITVLTERYLP